jgi:hypothetical protein
MLEIRCTIECGRVMEPGESNPIELAQCIEELFRTGPLVQFRCEPSSALKSEKVTVQATFFLPSKSPDELRPVVICKESEMFSLQLTEDSTNTSEGKAFHGDLEVVQLKNLKGDVATLMLKQHPDSTSPIASTILHLFDPEDLLNAKNVLSRW